MIRGMGECYGPGRLSYIARWSECSGKENIARSLFSVAVVGVQRPVTENESEQISCEKPPQSKRMNFTESIARKEH